MTIIETAKITSKGQVTIPSRIREILHVSSGASLAFGLSKEGIILLPCKIPRNCLIAPKSGQRLKN